MEIKDLKQAEELLIRVTQNDNIHDFIVQELQTWDFIDSKNRLDFTNINQLFAELDQEIFKENQSHVHTAALHWFVFDRLHDLCITKLKEEFSEKDDVFFEKCKALADVDVTAQHFGADENYNIPLAAAIVELSVLDGYRTPDGKMNCFCGTFDLVFAEIKTAMVKVISENSEKENDIPIVDNRDVLPVLMVVIIKSKLVHMFTNLFYTKCFSNLKDCAILESFQKATEAIMKINLADLQPIENKVLKNIDLEEFMKITSNEEEKLNGTLVDEANRRVLDLITKATFDQ